MPHSPVIVNEALERYLYTNSTLKDIAKSVGVPYNTLHTWYNSQKWPEQRRKLAQDLAERAKTDRQRIIRENVASVMRRHLKVGERIEQEVENVIDDLTNKGKKAMSSSKLVDVSKAFQSSAQVTGRVVGLEDKGSSHVDGAGVNVLINTNFTPEPVSVTPDPSPAIDAESIEVTEDIDPECGF